MNIIGAIFAFSLLVIVHEFGHFALAKLNGVKVEEFSIGMGPKLFGLKKGETQYNVKLLPIGGYVRMLGEDGEETTDDRAFSNKSSLQKLSIVAAGPFMNLILAIVLFGVISASRGYYAPIVDRVEANNPAQIAGIQKGDEILKVNNKKILTWEDFVTEVYTNGKSTLNITYKRQGEVKTTKVTPVKNEEENRYVVGIYPTAITNPSIGQSISYGFVETNSLISQTFGFLKTMFKGKVSVNDFGGPLTIIKVSGKAAEAGFLSLMSFAAYLSVQLAIFNIIPFPALDGGWIILFLIEIITRRKIDSNKVGVINYIGFAILMTLMVLVTVKDILYPVNL
ncbi:membrane metalloprotease [Clostridium tetanomorphum DSM 665]|uniref:Zinc metalloprotease n=1 Tax=Clostridium tetanomorphum TaxID=1553 RepID=A0A923EDU4_CLOTT|nr:RIP metalloprotease RseP [Clostridium tetanomorphum]KAJ51561.1 membrane metalloprotease [Clostridium tetanomorphum DSM 665]MBC2398915.1 RIP metalloprotease RseP [Clostridium tetanomorphum]